VIVGDDVAIGRDEHAAADAVLDLLLLLFPGWLKNGANMGGTPSGNSGI